MDGRPRLRDRDHPDGLLDSDNMRMFLFGGQMPRPRESREQIGKGQVQVRLLASLEHPYDAYRWDLTKVRFLYEEGWNWKVFSCCWVGDPAPT